ncbi:MAG: J domain-containing protein [Nocardioides sp.]|nr:J domain-containing protein [Nocardioides sp.]
MTRSRPTLYDILGVLPEADAATIKAAWRSSADRFDPTEGAAQFRLFNEAAEVLLDPRKRAAYDAELAADRTREAAGPSPVSPPAQEVRPTGESGAAEPVEGEEGPARRSRLRRWVAGAIPVTRSTTTTAEDTSPASDDLGADDDTPASRGAPPLLLVACVAVLAVLATVGAVFVTLEAREAQATDRARSVAPSAAAEAAERVLSYSFESIAADRDAGMKYFTGNYRDDYVETMDSVIADGAAQVQAVVEADVLETAVVRAEPGGAEVLLYVNQVTTSTANDGEPTTALNRVRFSMVEQDGTWLVDDIQSY